MEIRFVRPVPSAESRGAYTPDADLAVNTMEQVNNYEDEFRIHSDKIYRKLPKHHTDTIQEVRIQQLKVHVK